MEEKRECPYCKKLVNVSRVLAPAMVFRNGAPYIYDEERFICSVCKKEFCLPELFDKNEAAKKEAFTKN